MSESTQTLRIGGVIHGFARGSFGRDSYDCRRIEALGIDWVVTRNQQGEVEFTNDLSALTADARDCNGVCYLESEGGF